MDDAAYVRDYFIRAATTFDSLYAERAMGPVARFFNQRLRRDIYERFLLTMSHVRAHKLQTALDVGCGSGRYAGALAELGVRRIVGVDFSPKMIELALAHTDPLRAAGRSIEFVCSDFMTFETAERFEVVIAMGFFDYTADALPFLRKMRTLATHSVIGSFPSISLYRTPIRKVRYAIKRCPVYFYQPQQFSRLATDAGFSRHEVRKIPGAGMDYVVTFFV